MQRDPKPSERVPGIVAVVAACVPLVLAVLGDPSADAHHARAVTLGCAIAGDRSGSIPLAQWFAPLATLIPIGSFEARAAIGMAIPATIATWLVTSRAARAPFGAARWSATLLVLAFGGLAGVMLSTASMSTALVVVAIEAAMRAAEPRARHRRDDWASSIAIGLSLLACWASPRLAPVSIATAFLVLRLRAPAEGWRGRALGIAGALAIPLVGLLVVRDRSAWLVIGRPFRDGAFARVHELVPSGALLRVSIVALVLALFALIVAPKSVDRAERALFLVSVIGFACGVLLGAEGAFAVVVVALLPTAAAAASAIAMTVSRRVEDEGDDKRADAHTFGRRAIAAFVPVLALGLVARAIEVELSTHHLDPDPAGAHTAARLFGHGIVPPRAVIVVEDEGGLLRWAASRALDAARPDVRVLPTHGLLLGGSARLSSRTIAELPSAAAIVRGLLAHSVLEEADLAPLAQDVNVVTDLAAHRLLPVARHVDPYSGLLHVALARFDPSDRRLRRVGLERRTRMLARSLASRGEDDPLRAHLRLTSFREARVLAVAGDRDAALVALLRAQALGASIERWFAKVSARQSIENDPPPEGPAD